MSTDELKKLANWGMYRFDTRAKKPHQDMMAFKRETVIPEVVAKHDHDKESLSSRFRARSSRPDSALNK